MRWKTILLIFVAMMTLIGPAGAAILGLNWGIGDRYHGYSVYWNGQWHNNVYAGSLAATLDGAAIGQVFCVDLSHDIGIPTSYPVNVLDTSALTNGARAAWLYNTYLPQLSSNEMAAGLQLALWNTVYDNDSSVNQGSGTFYVGGGRSDDVVHIANDMLTESNGKTASTTYFKSSNPSDPKQDMIGPVPEPNSAALLLLGAALSGVGVIYRRRR